jgi:hypothetical protein
MNDRFRSRKQKIAPSQGRGGSEFVATTCNQIDWIWSIVIVCSGRWSYLTKTPTISELKHIEIIPRKARWPKSVISCQPCNPLKSYRLFISELALRNGFSYRIVLCRVPHLSRRVSMHRCMFRTISAIRKFTPQDLVFLRNRHRFSGKHSKSVNIHPLVLVCILLILLIESTVNLRPLTTVSWNICFLISY